MVRPELVESAEALFATQKTPRADDRRHVGSSSTGDQPTCANGADETNLQAGADFCDDDPDCAALSNDINMCP